MDPESEDERYPVVLIAPNGQTISGEFLLDNDEHGDVRRLTLRFETREIVKEADDFFDALILIRRELEHDGLVPRCYGASRNVYPSSMSRQMGGGGVRAYRLDLGQQGRIKDLVNIFEDGPDVELVSPDDQEAYYEEWLRSIGWPPAATSTVNPHIMRTPRLVWRMMRRLLGKG